MHGVLAGRFFTSFRMTGGSKQNDAERGFYALARAGGYGIRPYGGQRAEDKEQNGRGWNPSPTVDSKRYTETNRDVISAEHGVLL